MSGSGRPEDEAVTVDPILFVIVKFRAGVEETSLRGLAGNRFSTREQDPNGLPDLLNWPDIFNETQGENSISFGPLSTELGFDQLRDLDKQGRDFRQLMSGQHLNLELDREGNPVNWSGDIEPPAPELETFFRIDLELAEGKSEEEVIAFYERLIELINQRSDTVEMAYLASDAAPPPRSRTAYLDPANATHPQGYFAPRARGGIGIASFLAVNPQADGKLVNLIDVEQGWYGDHPDLPGIQFNPPFKGDNIALKANFLPATYAHDVGLHGLMTLGLLVAKHNGQGVNGIAPGIASLRLSSEWKFSKQLKRYVRNTYDAITGAANALRAGDVLLIEGQQQPPIISVDGVNLTKTNAPVELRPDLFNAILAATQKGVTVIEPTGNNLPNGISLDNVSVTVSGTVYQLFKKDSGAILVAAGANALLYPETFARAASSNFGKYIDCFADGDWLWVLDPPATNRPVGNPLTPAQLLDLYVEIASGGTSSASAIVAGVAVLLQSLARQSNRIIPPLTLRTILSDALLNTPSMDPPTDRIGVMPDLDAIMATYNKLATVSIPAPP